MHYTVNMDKDRLLEKAKPYFDENQVYELALAIDVATDAHKGQKRLSGHPYISHPLEVASILIDWGMDMDSVIAGVLHDTMEDADMSIEEIETIFGHDVSFLVDGVTKVTRARAGMRSLDSYLPQTSDNLSKLLMAVGQDVRVIIIKLADRLHNLQTLSNLPADKQRKIARESLEVFASIADQLGMGRARMQIEEISFSFLDPKEFNRLKNLLRKRLGKSTRKLGVIRHEVEQELKKSKIIYEMDGRIKSIYSLHKKLKKVDNNIDDIYDLMALRIIVDSKDDCYKVLGILHTLYQPILTRIKDYISIPKPNGYQSLHTTVLTKNKQIVEFQIRTKEMHEYAERGLAASFHYNASKDSKSYIEGKTSIGSLPTNLQWITQLQEVAADLRSGREISKDQLFLDLFSDRIFVYSPKGDIFNLPEGSLPLDYAYRVHSDIGYHAYSFKVNGNIYPFDKPLKNGDIVEVITRKNSSPKADWIDLVRTSHARDKLRSHLNKESPISLITKTAKEIAKHAFNRKPKKKI